MKSTLLLSALLAVILAGCATTSKTQLTGSIAKLAVRRGTVELLKAKPQYRPQLTAAKGALDLALSLDQPTTADLKSALATIPMKEIQGDQGLMLVADVKDLLNLLAQLVQIQNLDTSGLKDILHGVDDGLTDALALTAPPVPTP